MQRAGRDGIRATKKLKHKRRRGGTNLDVDQCIDVRWVLNRCVSEIGSLGLQKLVVATTMDFSGVPFPSLTLLLIMVVVVHVVAIIQE